MAALVLLTGWKPPGAQGVREPDVKSPISVCNS